MLVVGGGAGTSAAAADCAARLIVLLSMMRILSGCVVDKKSSSSDVIFSGALNYELMAHTKIENRANVEWREHAFAEHMHKNDIENDAQNRLDTCGYNANSPSVVR